ncbi:hypothetical protein Psch_02317 [Pelotomaculum schinkii]|uniref:Uncharacterized protein n=1 Tax=Pelotomaculum schinkii TaxID=78350 RepID=A0A4Y7R914_9FIRM|nr:hypothetical protein Psch_02317 [Pelotomaculum schinkii]
MTPSLVLPPAIVTGLPISPIIFPILWFFLETFPILRVRIGTPVVFPFLWLAVV